MGKPWFEFNGKKSSDYSIYTNEMPPEQYPEDEIEYIEVPGRDGYLSINNNRKMPIEKMIEATLIRKENRDVVKRWLKGDGKLILSTEPDVYYKARVVTPVQYFGTIYRGRRFGVNFLCQPWAYLIEGDGIITITTKNTVINNPEELSKPLIKIYGSGAVDLIINSKIHKFNINGHITVDSELKESYKDNSLVPFTGDFPELRAGNNNISWTGTVTQIEVNPQWRR